MTLRATRISNSSQATGISQGDGLVPVASLFVLLIVPILSFVLYLVRLAPDYWNIFDSAAWHFNAVRACFVATAATLPAFLFYLHAATRRESAFNAFATALNRLGLLSNLFIHDMSERETELARSTRIAGYIDRFSAVYGTSPDQVARRLTAAMGHKEERLQLSDESFGPFFQLRTLVAPLGVTLVAFLGWIVALPPLRDPLSGFEQVFTPTLDQTTLAFLGAYVFSLEMIRRRFVLRDIGINLYTGILIRLIFSIALAAVLVSPRGLLGHTIAIKDVNTEMQNALAFAIGATPMVYFGVAIKAVQQYCGFGLSRGDLPLRYMDGIDIWQEARLDEEDIQDIENLACANLVHLIITTRYSADRLVDWVDQAILYCALGVQPEDQNNSRSARITGLRHKLRLYGIRSASDLADEMKAEGRAIRQKKTFTFPSCLGPEDSARVRAIAEAMKNHPNFPLVRNWRFDIRQDKADQT